MFAHAAVGVRRTAKLLSELNEVQSRSSTARVQLIDDTVVVTQTISPIGLTLPVLAQAFGEVARVADGIGPLFAAMFDGATPHPVTVPEDEQAAGPP